MFVSTAFDPASLTWCSPAPESLHTPSPCPCTLLEECLTCLTMPDAEPNNRTRETPSCAQVARLKAMATRTASLLQEALEDRGSTTTKAAALGKRRSRPAGGQDTTWLRLFSCPLEPLDAVLLLQKVGPSCKHHIGDSQSPSPVQTMHRAPDMPLQQACVSRALTNP